MYRFFFPQDTLSPTSVSSPSSSRLVSQIIGAEDDYFDSDQEQVFYHRAILVSLNTAGIFNIFLKGVTVL